MMGADLEKEIARIFSVLFKKEITPDSDISMDNEELWDSIKHIEIIMTLEEELGISFRMQDIPELRSMKKIIAKAKEE